MKTFEEVYATLPGNGWLSEDEARLLWLCCQKTDGAILEVGCYQGRSTVLLASFGRTVQCVDPFAGFCTEDLDGDKARAAFLANTRQLSNVFIEVCKVEDWGAFISPHIDLCYLDGDHTYEGVQNDITAIAALLCPGAMIAFHDYFDARNNTGAEGYGVVRAVKNTLSKEFVLKEQCVSMAVFQRQ